jgi:hypothetical protein
MYFEHPSMGALASLFAYCLGCFFSQGAQAVVNLSREAMKQLDFRAFVEVANLYYLVAQEQ